VKKFSHPMAMLSLGHQNKPGPADGNAQSAWAENPPGRVPAPIFDGW